MQNGFEFKIELINTVPEVTTSFLLITYALLTTIGLRGGGPWQGGANGFAVLLSITFNL